jgi:hypothetical protein
MTDEEYDLALLQANYHFQNPTTGQWLVDFMAAQDIQQVKPGIGEMMKNALSNAIKYLGQKLAGFFTR